MITLNYIDLTEKLPFKTSVALGSFEAIHKGHAEIIKKAVEFSKRNNTKSVVTVFEKPVLKKRQDVCETFSDRLSIIENFGVDIVIVLDFNDDFKKIDYKTFFKEFIVGKLNASGVFSGFNYRFGYNAEGSTDKLKKLCFEYGIHYDITKPVVLDELVSSTYIYRLITDGNVEKLSLALNRNYSLSGVVKKGRGIGRKLSFPTANISIPTDKAVLKSGVYFGRCIVENNSYYALINVGMQPTVTIEKTPKIEAFLIDFDGNLYNKEIKLEFIKRIRDIIKFSCEAELIEQLNNDLNVAKNYITM